MEVAPIVTLTLSEPLVTGESCFETLDGSALVVVDSALTDSVFYELTAPGFVGSGVWTDGVFEALIPGDFVLEVYDGDSTCSAVEVFTVAAAPDVSLFLVASAPACAGGDDGSVSAFVAGNVMATSYQLNGEPASIDGNFLGLSAGEYFVNVNVLTTAGMNTCSDTASITVVDPEGMEVIVDEIGGANPGRGKRRSCGDGDRRRGALQLLSGRAPRDQREQRTPMIWEPENGHSKYRAVTVVRPALWSQFPWASMNGVHRSLLWSPIQPGILLRCSSLVHSRACLS